MEEIKEKIETILDGGIWDSKECPYCDYVGDSVKQTIHHICAAHEKEYKSQLTKEAKLLDLISDVQRETLQRIEEAVDERKPSFVLRRGRQKGVEKMAKIIYDIVQREREKIIAHRFEIKQDAIEF